MNDIALSSLRVGAEFDASKYKAGADQKAASDREMTSSSQALGAALTQTDTKISTSGNVVSILARRYVEGQKETQAFERDLRSLSRQIETGKVSIEGAATILVGMNQKLGLSADVSQLAAKGQVQLAAAVGLANTQIEGQVVALTQAAAAHAAMIAQARADQAAENSRQIGAANQNSFNNVLGVQTAPSAGARSSASVFEAEFARVESIAQLKASQIGQTFGIDLEASLVGATRKSAREAASVFESEMDRIDQIAAMKAQQAGGYFQQDFNARMGIGRPANSARESADVFANAPRTGGPRLSGYQMQGLGFQANDVVTMALLGAPASQIAFSQGGQILQNLQMGEGGIAGSLNAIKGSAGAAGTSLVGMLGTTGLIATGFGIAAVAAGAFYLLTREKAKTSKELIQNEASAVRDLGNAYGDAAKGVQVFATQSVSGFNISSANTINGLKLALASTTRDLGPDIGRFVNPGKSAGGFFAASAEFKPFADAIAYLQKTAREGTPDILGFRKMVEDRWALDPNNDALTKAAGKLQELTKDSTEAAKALRELEIIRNKLFNDVGPTGTLLSQGTSNRADMGNLAALNVQQAVAAQRQQQAFDAQTQSMLAKSPAELAAAARARETATYNNDEGAQARRDRIDLAGKRALIDAEHQLKEAQDQRNRSLDQTVASAKLDVDLIGKTTAQAEAARQAFQLEAQVREEAARNGIKSETEFQKVYGAEIALIKEKAAELGKIKALQEARDTVHSQEQDLELQRAEISAVGMNKLAHDALIESLKTEQKIRNLGADAIGAEADKLRANTAAAAANAEALAKASMQADLLFERSQILRNSDDQQIASALKSAGLPIDLNSQEAQMMRYNMALQETKDTFKGFFSDMQSSLEQGKSLWESFGDAAKNALTKIADKLLDKATDDIFNSLFGGQKAGGGGLLGSLFGGSNSSGQNGQQQSSSGGSFLSKLFGGGGQSVGSMDVQATVVNVNGGVGGVGGGLSDILSKLGSPSFKADTTLSDILGYGAANTNGPNTAATAAKLLSGLGSPLGGSASVTGGAGSALSQVFASAGVTKTGIPLSGIGIDGLTAKVATEYAGRFQGLLNDLKGAGYPITSLGEGGYSFRNVAGTNNLSNHAFGNALDINPRENPWAVGAKGNFSQYGVDPSALAQKNGLFWGGNWNKADAMHFQVDKSIDMESTTKSISKLGTASSQATSALSGVGGASESLISQFSKMGQSLLSQLTPATSSTGWFQNLAGMFGGSSGALGYMNSISPAATSDILSGSWGLFDDGGFTGRGGRKEAAGIVHRGEVVWSQDDIARAGGVHVVEGMRRGFGGYADGGVVRSRMRYDGTSSPRQSAAPSAANDRPAQNINQTNNFIFRENPAAPASQNQIAAKSARALERLTRTQ